MTDEKEIPILYFGEPDWMPQLRRLAARLGVPAGESEGDGTSFLLIGFQGEMYDAGAICEALLDRLEAG